MQLWIAITIAGLASACTLENPGFTGESASSASDSATTDPTTISTSDGTETSSGSDTGTTNSTSSTSGGLTSTGPSSSGDVTTDATTTDGMCAEDPIKVFLDEDGDLFGNGPSMTVCPDEIPSNYIDNDDDCNDSDDAINPGAIEECDGIDNNCNGILDEYSANNPECEILGTTCFLKEYDGHYYYACAANLFPSTVNKKCKKLASQGAEAYHVQLTNKNENKEMESLLSQLKSDASIGLKDKSWNNNPESFVWVRDGSKVEGYGSMIGQDPWATDKPDKGLEQWTKIHEKGLTWDDIGDLGDAHPFICEAEPAS